VDSETQIAERLKQNIPTEETTSPEARVVGTTTDTEKDLGYVDNAPFDELTKYKLCEQFNIPTHMQSDPKTIDKLSLVYGWAATVAGSEDFLAINVFLRNAEATMGYSSTQNRLDRFYQFAKLDLQRRKIEQEMQYA